MESEMEMEDLDFENLLEYCVKENIDYEECETKEDVLALLKSKKASNNKLESAGSPDALKNTSNNVLGNIMMNNSKMEEDLREVYNDILHLMKYAGNSIEQDIRSILNEKYGEYKKQIQRRLEQLKKRECPILVLGETSSGKSSLINLLVEEDILPEAHLAETKMICRLHNSSDIWYEAEYSKKGKYSKKFKTKEELFAELRKIIARRTNNQTNNAGQKHTQELSEVVRNDAAQRNNNQENNDRPRPKQKLYDNFRDVLLRQTNNQDDNATPKQGVNEGFRKHPVQRHSTKDNNQENDDPLKLVDVYCPLPFLPDFVTIVDSPGVGEDDSLTEEVLQYLPQAVAFIFVLDSSNAGGIQTDKLGMILEKWELKKSMGELVPFDFKNSIVICNKWDVIEKSGEESKVWDQTVKRLQAMMPLLEKDHIFQLSVKKAKRHRRVVSGNTEAFEKLLLGFKRILPGMMRAKLSHHLRWQDDVLKMMWDYARSRIRLSYKSATDLNKYRIDCESQLNELEKKSKEAKLMLEAACQEKHKTAVEALHSYLMKPEVKKSFIDWRKEKTPEHLSQCADQEVIYLEITKRISSRLHQMILEWEEQEHLLRSTSSELGGLLKEKCLAIGSQCNEIDFNLDEVPENNFDEELEEALSLTYSEPDPDFNLETTGKVVLAATAPIWIPAGLVAVIISIPIVAAVAGVQSINRRLNYARTDFQRELHSYSEQVVENAFGKESLQTIITKSYFSAINDKIDSFFESKIGNEIASKRMMLHTLTREVWTSTTDIENIRLFLSEVETIKKKFRRSFGNLVVEI